MGLTNNLGKLSNMITSTGSAVGIGTSSPVSLLNLSATTPTLTITDSAATGNGGNVYISAIKSGVGYNNLTFTGYSYTFLGGGSASTFLTINTAGAATFSSSLTVNGVYFVPSTSYFRGNSTFGYRFNNAADTANLFVLADSGAATFSSSVETTGAYFLNGNAYFGKASSIFTGGSANDAGIMVSGSNNIIFGNALTERMRITNAGNLGIGTSTANQKLTVSGDVNMYNYTSFTTSTKTAASGSNATFVMSTDYGLNVGGDNIGGLVVINISEAATSINLGNAAYVGIVINPRGSGGSINQITRALGGGITALSVSMSGNSIVVNATTGTGNNFRASLTFIGGGGTS